MTESRIERHVTAYPGVHFNQVVRDLDVTPDKLHRLAGQLEQEGRILTRKLYGKTHFYPPEFDEWEQNVLALLHRETAREILLVLLEDGPADPETVASAVGIARSTLEWHVSRLVDASVVEKNRNGRSVSLELVDADRLTLLLSESEPTLTDRWVDRTTRLFDHVLEDSS